MREREREREREKRMRKVDRKWETWMRERERRKTNLIKWEGRENNLNPFCDLFPEVIIESRYFLDLNFSDFLF